MKERNEAQRATEKIKKGWEKKTDAGGFPDELDKR